MLTPAHAAFMSKNSGLLFSFMNEMVRPVFDATVERAAVWFDRDGKCFQFSINPDFWASIGFLRQCFVLSHETLHVLLKHCFRERVLIDQMKADGNLGWLKLNNDVCNLLQDIEINESLVSSAYGFDRSLMIFDGGLCFVDTVFPEEVLASEVVPTYETFEFYAQVWLRHSESLDAEALLGLLLETHRPAGVSDEGSRRGHRCEGESDFEGEAERSWEDTMAEMEAVRTFLGDDITDQDLLSNAPGLGGGAPGQGSSGSYTVVLDKTRSLDDVFDLCIKGVAKLAKDPERQSTWSRPHALLHDVLRLTNPGSSLPGRRKYFKPEPPQKHILVYMDVSGSCFDYIKKMMSLIKNLPEDKYVLETYIFAGHVAPIDLNEPKFFSGGTEIDEMYRHASVLLAEKHYDGVFVLTDGEFESLYSNYSIDFKKWFWFLVPTYDRSHLPRISTVMRVEEAPSGWKGTTSDEYDECDDDDH
ncbi:hypothetical protein RYA05_00190 [Pseudomonas syringae pv. actinidiae]|nr:hypothetical protein [Pseudomonas syringae pv. actinidiae]